MSAPATERRLAPDTIRVFEGYHEDIEDTCLFDWVNGKGETGFQEIAFNQMKTPFGEISREIRP